MVLKTYIENDQYMGTLAPIKDDKDREPLPDRRRNIKSRDGIVSWVDQCHDLVTGDHKRFHAIRI